MTFVDFYNGFMEHWKIDGELRSKKSNKEDYAVTNFVSETGFTLTMFIFTKRKQIGEMESNKRHKLKYR